MKTALITGIYGQDGSFLCEKLFAAGYKIYGIAKEELSENGKRIKEELLEKDIKHSIRAVNLYEFDEISTLISELKPNEIYHMAAYHVSSEGKGNAGILREQELYNKNVLATANLLEACYLYSPDTRILTAGSCLMYDGSGTFCQTESTPYQSNSLYGMAKISENMLVEYYRKKGLFACTAILYNHESHRRSSGFVTKKIVENMIALREGISEKIQLGNIDVKKDWGYAGDYAEGMYMMLQCKKPKDYILSSGELHTIKEFVEKCAEKLGISRWQEKIEIDNSIINRKISGELFGSCVCAENELGWKKTKNFDTLIDEMISYELKNKSSNFIKTKGNLI